MRTERVARTLLPAVVLASALVACGPDDQPPSNPVRDLDGIPVREGATQPPGTPLGPGFTVAEGAHLVGTVFPNQHDDGWRAALLVTGDPSAVLESYRQQAKVAGVPMRNSPVCERTREALKCAVDGATDSGDRTLHVALWRGRVGDTPLSHAYIELAHAEAHAVRAPLLESAITVDAPPLPRGWELPEVGSEFVGGVHIEPGSELAAPIAFVRGDDDRGFRGVLRVTGTPVEVVRNYDRQWPNEGNIPEPEPWSDPDGAYVIGATGRRIGGEQYGIEMVIRPGHPTWAWVTTRYD